MRANLVSSIAVTCAAALALPLSLATPAASLPPVAPTAGDPAAKFTSDTDPASAADPAAPPEDPPASSGPAYASASASTSTSTRAETDVAGATQSLPLGPIGSARRALGAAAAAQGLTRRDVRPFSLVGVVWDDARAELHGTVQVRTRAAGSGNWSGWQEVEIHNEDHAADPGTPEATAGGVRGATAPLWVGDSDGVEIRVLPEQGGAGHGLPGGLRLELVDPGPEPTSGHGPDAASDPGSGHGPDAASNPANGPGFDPASGPGFDPASGPGFDPASGPEPGFDPGAGAPPATRALAESRTAPTESRTATTETRTATPRALRAPTVEEAAATSVNAHLAPVGTAAIPAAAAAKPYIGPRPKIVTRKGWGADEKLREKGFVYTKAVKAAFVHHSATGNNYTCRQAPSVLRSIYRYHVKSSGWRDFGYNFAVDKCGTIYEGRAGGVAKPVLGAHTLGFNTNSMGIAVLGSYAKTTPPAAVVTAVARLTAWKLGLHGVNPKGKVTLTSGGGNLYKKGKKVKFNAIAGHRDGFATACPGARLYGKLGTARSASAKYQGRR